METEISTEISTGPLSRYLPVCRAQLCYSLQSTSQAWSGSPASQASHRRAAASISGNMNTYILDTAVIIQISEVIYDTFLFAEEGVLSNIKCGFTWKSTYSTHTCDITRYSTIFVTLDSIYIIYTKVQRQRVPPLFYIFSCFICSKCHPQHSQSQLHLTSWFSLVQAAQDRSKSKV